MPSKPLEVEVSGLSVRLGEAARLFACIGFVLLSFLAVHPLVAVQVSTTPWMYVRGDQLIVNNNPFFMVGASDRGQASHPLTKGTFDDWYTYRIEDAKNIGSYGFNTVRLVVYWEQLEVSSNSSEFIYDYSYIGKIRLTVKAFNARGIYVIIDLHESAEVNYLARFLPTAGNDMLFARGFYTDTGPTAASEHLKRLWLTLSEVFKDQPGVAGYELCNEPHYDGADLQPAGSLAKTQVENYWFGIVDYVTAALRNVGDRHIIFVDFSPWSTDTRYMTRTVNDTNVVYTPHFYSGLNSTTLTVTNDNLTWLQSRFDYFIKSTLSHFRVAYVMGEFGFESLDVIPTDSRGIWLKNVLSILRNDSAMRGWIYWSYVAYEGVVSADGWQSILVQSVPTQVATSSIEHSAVGIQLLHSNWVTVPLTSHGFPPFNWRVDEVGMLSLAVSVIGFLIWRIQTKKSDANRSRSKR